MSATPASVQLHATPTFSGGSLDEATRAEEVRFLQNGLAEAQKLTKAAGEKAAELELRLVCTEEQLLEAKTALVVAVERVHSADECRVRTEEEQTNVVNDLNERIRSLTDRLRAAPAIDRGLANLYVEARDLLAENYGAQSLTDEDLKNVERCSAIENLANLRFWLRRLLNQRVQLLKPTSAPEKGDETNSAMSESLRKLSSLHTMLPSVDAAVECAALKAELEQLRLELKDAAQASWVAQQSCRMQSEMARHETALAKQEVRAKDKLIKQLSADLRSQTDDAPTRVALEASQHENTELKCQMKVMTESKRQDLEGLKRSLVLAQKEAAVTAEQLVQRTNEVTRLNSQLKEAQSQLAALKGQMSRVNIKTLVERKNKAQALAQRQEQQLQQLGTQLTSKTNLLKYFETTNRKMVEEYNALFEANWREQQQRKAESRRAAGKEAEKVTCGPGSELNHEYLRNRYEDALVELKQAQAKMKRVLLTAHTDRLCSKREVEALETELHERTVLLRHAQGRNDQLAQSVSLAQSYESMLSSCDELPPRDREFSNIHTEPSIRVSNGATEISVPVPAIGAATEFGNPLTPRGISYVRTSSSNETSEVSRRAVVTSTTQDALANHQQLPQSFASRGEAPLDVPAQGGVF